MAYTYEEINPTLIENTTMQKMLLNGVHRTYVIQANEGFVLHDKALDGEIVDDMTGEVLGITLGYTRGSVSCAASYNFTTNTREFYAVPENEVPADQIFGNADQPEIM